MGGRGTQVLINNLRVVTSIKLLHMYNLTLVLAQQSLPWKGLWICWNIPSIHIVEPKILETFQDFKQILNYSRSLLLTIMSGNHILSPSALPHSAPPRLFRSTTPSSSPLGFPRYPLPSLFPEFNVNIPRISFLLLKYFSSWVLNCFPRLYYLIDAVHTFR